MKRKYTVLGSGLLLLALLAWFGLVSLLAGFIIDIPILSGGQASVYLVYIVTGIAELLLIVPLIIYMAIKGISFKALMGNRTSLVQNLLAVALGILLVPALSGVDSLFSELFKLMGAKNLDTSALLTPRTVGQMFVGFAAIGLTAGVVEEPIFRGVVQRGFGSATGMRAAIVLTALAFSFFHLDIMGATERFVIGLLLGYMAWRAGAILPGMLTHVAFNSTSVGMMLLMGIPGIANWNGFQLGLSPDFNNTVTWILISIPFALAAAGVYWLFVLVTPKTAAWSVKPYAAAEVRTVHILPWIGVGLALLVLTACTALLMWLPLDKIMSQLPQYIK